MATKTTTTKPAAKKSATKTSSNKSSSDTGKIEESEFHEFFVDELKDIYWAETHLAKALPKMKKAASSADLAAAFDKHTAETQTHVQTLEQVFELLGEKASAKKCDAMAGLLEEANGIIEDTEDGTAIRDCGLILGAQKIEHYEIATYGGLYTLANTIGHTEVAELLQQTLENEKTTDDALTALAEGVINQQAASE